MLSIQDRIAKPRPILLDGATGTELNRRGVNTDLPLWSARALLEAPEVLLAIHKDYIDAGAEVITTNTFRTHRRSLNTAGLGGKAQILTTQAVEIAKQAVASSGSELAQKVYIAGSISPLEDCYLPHLVPPQAECLLEHQEMASTLAAAGVDLLLIETINTIREAVAAAQAAQITGLPFIVSFVCNRKGNLLSGESLQMAVNALEKYEAISLAVNCVHAADVHNPLSALHNATDLPTGVYANIGAVDESQGWDSTSQLTPEDYAEYAANWTTYSPSLIGGCCGTTPKHISILKQTLNDLYQ